jgi:hypothetical protein
MKAPFMNKPYIAITLIAGVLLLSGCSKKIMGLSVSDVAINELDFNYLSAKAKIRYEDGKRSLLGTAQIRIEKDSAIWVSLSPGFGVEVGRLLVIKDSVFFIDKINNKYLKADYRQLSKVYDFQLNYGLIQAIMIGNLLFPSIKSELSKSETGSSFKQNNERYQIKSFVGKESRKLEQVSVEDVETKTLFSVNYSDFRPLDETSLIAYAILVTVESLSKEKPKTIMDVTVNKVVLETDAQKFPFNVPDKFEAY